MRSFVLVHGAWHGGWCYRDVARLLRGNGHEVWTPTLTGLGERKHLGHLPITLDTHVEDVVNLVVAEELSEVILVGHSYGGMVVSGVSERLCERLSALIYLDAFVPSRSGDSLTRLVGTTDHFMRALDGVGIPAPSAEYFGVATQKNRDWVDRRCVAQPIGTALQALELSDRFFQFSPKHYVLATKWGDGGRAPFAQYRDQVNGQPGWTTHELACGHDVMVDSPEQTASLLEMVVASLPPRTASLGSPTTRH